MKLTGMFRNTPPSMFCVEYRKWLESLQKVLADALLDVHPKDKVCCSLLEAEAVCGSSLQAAMNQAIRKDPYARRLVSTYAFKCAWLLDGGANGSMTSEYCFEENTSLLVRHGLHHLLLNSGFLDPEHALKGASAFIHNWLGSSQYSDTLERVRNGINDSNLCTVSLQSFSPDPPPINQMPTSSLNLFSYYNKIVATDPGMALVIDDEFALIFVDSLQRYERRTPLLLQLLIYNGGLRLKTAGRSVSEIAAFLNPLLDQMINALDDLSELRGNCKLSTAFKRQALLNLFAPFPKDLAFFDAKPQELQGHSSVSSENTPGALVTLLLGPLYAFGADTPGAAAKQLERYGIPVDLNYILCGLLRGHSHINDLVADLGRCKKLDEMLARFIRSGVTDQVSYSEVIGLSASLNYIYDQFGIEGKLAICALEAEKAHVASKNWDSLDSNPALRSIKERLDYDPELRSSLLGYLIKHERKNAAVLLWCGYTMGELKLHRVEVPEILVEGCLSSDLGL